MGKSIRTIAAILAATLAIFTLNARGHDGDVGDEGLGFENQPSTEFDDSSSESDVPQGIIQDGNTFFTSFENLPGSDGDPPADVTNFFVGDVFFFNNNADVGAAATRGFPPGYRTGGFVFLTSNGVSTLFVASNRPNKISFWAKDIVELDPFVQGFLLVTYQNYKTDFFLVDSVFTRFDLRNVARIDVVTTGITNIDDFSYTSQPKKKKRRGRRERRGGRRGR